MIIVFIIGFCNARIRHYLKFWRLSSSENKHMRTQSPRYFKALYNDYVTRRAGYSLGISPVHLSCGHFVSP